MFSFNPFHFTADKCPIQNDNTAANSPVTADSELASGEDGSEDEKHDVDMENGQDSPTAGPAIAIPTHSPKDDDLQTPPAPEAVELPSIMDIDRHTLVEVLGASPEGIQDDKSLRKASSAYNGRTAEDDSPLTSADTRETPSPLLLSGDNAFSRQMDDDRDHSEDEDDGNLSDATASTVPLSRHSDDDDNALSEAETEKSRPRTEARQLPKAGMVPPLQSVTPRASTSTNGKVTSTAYKRRRVMSPSSPIEGDDQFLTSPSQRGSPVYPRKASGRAPSSSLSPVLPSNSLAEMFDEEEPQTQSRQRQPTPIKRDYAHQTPTKKDTIAEVSQLVSSSRMDVPVEAKQDSGEPDPVPVSASAPVSEAASLPPSSLPTVDDKPPVSEPVTTQLEAETAPEPAPPPKKRKLDLKKFMAAKLQSPADVTTPNPFEAPAPPMVTPAPPTEEPSPVAKEPVASPFSLGIPAPLPPVASPPPPPPAQSPANEKLAELAPSPWWTAPPPKARLSFTSFPDSRPAIGENSVPFTDSAVVAGETNVPSPVETRSDVPKPVPVVIPSEEPAVTASAVISPSPDTQVKVQAALETASEAVAAQNGSFDFGSEAPKQEPLPGLTSPSTWQTKLPATVTSHWSRIPPALEQKDLPPHVDPEARRVDRFALLATAVRSPPKAALPLTSPQRLPPAGPRASLLPVRPLDVKEVRDSLRDARETERERDLMREREREREVPRGPRMEYRGRGSAVRGSPFGPRGGWHGETYRGRGRGTGEFRGRGFFPRGRGAFFNSRGRGV